MYKYHVTFWYLNRRPMTFHGLGKVLERDPTFPFSRTHGGSLQIHKIVN